MISATPMIKVSRYALCSSNYLHLLHDDASVICHSATLPLHRVSRTWLSSLFLRYLLLPLESGSGKTSIANHRPAKPYFRLNQFTNRPRAIWPLLGMSDTSAGSRCVQRGHVCFVSSSISCQIFSVFCCRNRYEHPKTLQNLNVGLSFSSLVSRLHLSLIHI